MNSNKFILIGLILIPLGIILGAIQAHYLEKIGMVAKSIESFGVGVQYLFYNGIACLAVAGIASKFSFDLKRPYRSILWGTVTFSGSIFVLTLLPYLGITVNKFLHLITPFGGIIMIHGWFVLLMRYLRTYNI